MKVLKIIFASIAVFVIQTGINMVTCGWLFKWVYDLEPTYVWKSMSCPPGSDFFLGSFLLDLLFVLVYVLMAEGIPGKGAVTKGMTYGIFIFATGILPGMFATYTFTNISPVVVMYWTFLGLAKVSILGAIAASIYGE